MFGYVRIRKPELKIKDHELYRAFYCGLCRCLLDRHGVSGRVTLSYDCTFLTILLSSLYELETEERECRCIVHPSKKHSERITEASRYAADMNVLLGWHHLLDDLADDRSPKAAAALRLYRRSYLGLKEKYPQQELGIRRELAKLRAIEKGKPVADPLSEAAGCFGRLMISVFRFRECFMQHELDGLAYHLGRFIYIMDAWDDAEEDKARGRFNPFTGDAESLLTEEIAKACWYFEKLPCVQYGDILRNILYAGVWNRYDKKEKKK